MYSPPVSLVLVARTPDNGVNIGGGCTCDVHPASRVAVRRSRRRPGEVEEVRYDEYVRWRLDVAIR
jgi:hypothetical protein